MHYVFGDLWRPDADFVSIVEDETAGTPVLEDGVVVLVLVELDTPVEPKHTHTNMIQLINYLKLKRLVQFKTWPLHNQMLLSVLVLSKLIHILVQYSSKPYIP